MEIPPPIDKPAVDAQPSPRSVLDHSTMMGTNISHYYLAHAYGCCGSSTSKKRKTLTERRARMNSISLILKNQDYRHLHDTLDFRLFARSGPRGSLPFQHSFFGDLVGGYTSFDFLRFEFQIQISNLGKKSCFGIVIPFFLSAPIFSKFRRTTVFFVCAVILIKIFKNQIMFEFFNQ